MTVWMLCPSIRPEAGDVFRVWREAGYRVATLVDGQTPWPGNAVQGVRLPTFGGYGDAINRLWQLVRDDADLIIAGADDLYPCETRSVADLAADFFGRFPDSFGVMHPAAHDLSGGTAADGAWFGRDYAGRINGGRGPFWTEYGHYFDDTEVKAVAHRLGVLWTRPDHGQRHDHWTLRQAGPPAHLESARRGWGRASRLFADRQASGFPGHEPLPAEL